MIRLVIAVLLIGLPAAAHAATRNFIIGSFEKVRVNGPFKLTVTTGKPPSGSATGSLDAVEAVTLQINGDTLVVSMGAGSWTSAGGTMIAPPAITVSTPRLQAATINSGAAVTIDAMTGQKVALALNGAGTLDVGAIDADQFEATIVGPGQMTLAGTAAKGRFLVSGPGSVEADRLIVDDLTVRSQGAGALSLAARRTADVTTAGLGMVTVAGSPSCTVHALAGGPIRCGTRGD
jgi:hypothetical protein